MGHWTSVSTKICLIWRMSITPTKLTRALGTWKESQTSAWKELYTQSTVHLFYPKVQPFNTPSLSPFLEGKNIYIKEITHKILTQLLNSFWYHDSISLSLISDSISLVLDNTQALVSVKVSRVHSVPEQKKSVELVTINYTPAKARMPGQFHSTCLLMQNIKSFLNSTGEIYSWVVILIEEEENRLLLNGDTRHLGCENNSLPFLPYSWGQEKVLTAFQLSINLNIGRLGETLGLKYSLSISSMFPHATSLIRTSPVPSITLHYELWGDDSHCRMESMAIQNNIIFSWMSDEALLAVEQLPDWLFYHDQRRQVFLPWSKPERT